MAAISVAPATSAEDIAAAKALCIEYAQSLNFSLCFQGFDEEMADFPALYAPPKGALLLGRVDSMPQGVVALKEIAPGICEMKRLYTRPAARGTGLGPLLVEKIVAAGRAIGYRSMKLDTIPAMAAAIRIYEAAGFRETTDYNGNPLPGAKFFERAL